MSASLSTVHDSVNALKKAAEPWSKDVRDAVDQISSVAVTLLKASCPSAQATECACASFRYAFSSLYSTFPTASLQLSAATFSAIVNDKISRAFKMNLERDKLRWESIAGAIVNGIQDHVEVKDNDQVKRAVAQAFYSNACNIFFSTSYPVPPTGYTIDLRISVYLLLSSTAQACQANKDKLLNSRLLGGAKLGRVIVVTKDYLALEELLNIFAVLMPITKGTDKGREIRMQFLQDCFVHGPDISVFAYGKDIVGLLEYIGSADWEGTCIKIVDVLAQDITVSQPFSLIDFSMSGTVASHLRPSERFYLDKEALLFNTENEHQQYEAMHMLYSGVRQIRISHSGTILVHLSSPPRCHDLLERISDDEPMVVTIGISPSQVDRFVQALRSRGQAKLVVLNGSRIISKATTRISVNQLPTKLEFGEDGRSIPDAPSYKKKVKIVEAGVSQPSEPGDDFPPSPTSPHLQEHPPSVLVVKERANVGAAASTSQTTVRAKPVSKANSRPLPAPTTPARIPGVRATTKISTAIAPLPAIPGSPPQRADPPARRPSHGPIPSRGSDDGNHSPPLAPPPALVSPRSGSCSQEDYEAVFGASDEELSNISDVESICGPAHVSQKPVRAEYPKRGTDNRRAGSRAGGRDPAPDAPAVPAIVAPSRSKRAATASAPPEPKLVPLAKGRGRRIVESKDEEEVAAPPKKSEEKKASKQKKRVVQEESEDEGAVDEAPTRNKTSRPSEAATGPPREKAKKGLADSARTKTASDAGTKQPKVTTTRGGRPTRASAAAASKKIAQAAKVQSQGSAAGEFVDEELGGGGKAEPSEKRDTAVPMEVEGEAHDVPEDSHGEIASAPIEVASVPQRGKRDTATKGSTIGSKPTPRTTAPKRKRDAADDSSIAGSRKFSIALPAKRPRVEQNVDAVTKSESTPRGRTLKKYGNRLRKDRTSSPVVSNIGCVDYDEIPDPAAVSDKALSSPVAKDSSPPTKIGSPATKSRVFGMKAKDGRVATPAKPTAVQTKARKDVAKPITSRPDVTATVERNSKPEKKGKTVRRDVRSRSPPPAKTRIPVDDEKDEIVPASSPAPPAPAAKKQVTKDVARSNTPAPTKLRNAEAPAVQDEEDTVVQFSSPVPEAQNTVKPTRGMAFGVGTGPNKKPGFSSASAPQRDVKAQVAKVISEARSKAKAKANKAPWVAAESSPKSLPPAQEPEADPPSEAVGSNSDDFAPEVLVSSETTNGLDEARTGLDDLDGPTMVVDFDPKYYSPVNKPEASRPPDANRRKAAQAKVADPKVVMIDLTSSDTPSPKKAPVRPSKPTSKPTNAPPKRHDRSGRTLPSKLPSARARPPTPELEPEPVSETDITVPPASDVFSADDMFSASGVFPTGNVFPSFRGKYVDSIVPLNSSGHLPSPTTEEDSLGNRQGLAKPPTPPRTRAQRKSVTFAPTPDDTDAAGPDEAEQFSESALREEFGKLGREAVARRERSAPVPERSATPVHDSAEMRTPPSPVPDGRQARGTLFHPISPSVRPHKPSTLPMSRAHVKRTTVEDERAASPEEPADTDGLQRILSIMNEITSAAHAKIVIRFENVSVGVRDLRKRILHQAADDLRELYADNVKTYNTLLTLESTYHDYSVQRTAALEHAQRVAKEGSRQLREILQAHDRGVQAHTTAAAVVGELPDSVTRWL